MEEQFLPVGASVHFASNRQQFFGAVGFAKLLIGTVLSQRETVDECLNQEFEIVHTFDEGSEIDGGDGGRLNRADECSAESYWRL